MIDFTPVFLFEGTLAEQQDQLAISRGEIAARDLVTGEIPLKELPDLFQHMKNRNGTLKVAVMP